MDEKKLPTSRLGRVSRLAWLGAQAGAGRVRGLIGRREESEQGVAEAAFQTLGQLRGLALKMGQMASYVDGVIPEQHRDLYEQTLKQLRSAAPTMSSEGAARVVKQDLGAEPTELFADWEPRPFAAASIGQVHRARLSGGEAVAVKVQIEGVNRAVQADLDNAGLMGGLVPMAGRMGVKDQIAELRARFLEELDYEGEAKRQQRFEQVFADHPRVRVPRVVPSLCSRRVLTAELIEGLDFEEACEADEASRRAWAETLWRFVFESILIHGLFNADPHPGNYRFGPDGIVYFLDFGCVKVLPEADRRTVCENHQLAVEGKVEAMRPAMLRMIGLPTEGKLAELAGDFVEEALMPMWRDGPFHFTRDYAGRLTTSMTDRKIELLRSAPGQLRTPKAQWLFFNRLQLGFYSVLARLDVEVDYRAIHQDILRQAEW